MRYLLSPVFVNASVAIGGLFTCERDHDNMHDKYAIADQTLVGHVPIELSKIFSHLMGRLRKNVLVLGTTKARGKGLKFQWIINL